MPDIGKKAKKKMQNEKKEFTVTLQGKALREYAKRLVTGKFTIEQQSLNRYKVIESTNNEQAYTLLNRRSFVLLDKEIYKLQAKENKLAACIEKALDSNKLEFTVRKAWIDAMNFKLIARTLSLSKVRLENVTTYIDNYIIKLSLIESISERALTEREKELVAMFQRANATASAGTPKTEMQALPAPEAVNTTAKTVETIPAK